MSRIKDLTGQRFGRLIVIGFAESKKKVVFWHCKCDCGQMCVVSGQKLKSGHTRSCGCLHKERISEVRTIHGMAGTRIYRIWNDMKRRCFNPERPNYERYGGRGITVCDEWRDNFQAFLDYVSKLEHFDKDGYSLDRIDNNGNYAPGNLRWVNASTQSRNRRSNIVVEYKGERFCLKEAAERFGIKYATLLNRYKKGLRGEALLKPIN